MGIWICSWNLDLTISDCDGFRLLLKAIDILFFIFKSFHVINEGK